MSKLLAVFLAVVSVVSAATSYPFAFYSVTLSVPNYVSVFSGSSNGQIAFLKQVPTGADGIPAGSGGAGSQHAIFVKDKFLFAVNPSSNSLSLFLIDESSPVNITLLNTVATGFDWPNTVTAHPTKDIACVATSGKSNGVRCFDYNDYTGLSAISGSDRSLGLNLTTPPQRNTGPAQIEFTPDGSGLAISVKSANPPVIYFPFSGSQVGANMVMAPPKGMVSFGFAFDTDGTMVLTDAAPTGTFSGVELVSLSSTAATFLLADYFLIPDQRAACWAERGPHNGHFYIVNAASQNVTEISRSGNTLTVLGNYGTGKAGPTDMTFVQMGTKTYAYVQNGATIAVFDVTTAGAGQLIQTADANTVGTYAIGAAVYVTSTPTSGPTTTPSTTPAGTPSASPSPSTQPPKASTTGGSKIATSSANMVVPSIFAVAVLAAVAL